MITRLIEAGWAVIHQPAHGLLAMQLALHWHPDNRPERWPETLSALLEHDDGQLPYEGRNHLTEAGAPKDFNVLDGSLEQAKAMIDIALQKSRWNALMVSMHATFLYEKKRGQEPELDEFLEQQTKNQQSWRRQYGVTKTEARYAYELVQWCDAFSLILCQKQVPPEGRRLEISAGPAKTSYYLSQRPDETLCIDPWPFEADTFTVRVEYAVLSQLSFADDRELYNSLQQAPISVQEWILKV